MAAAALGSDGGSHDPGPAHAACVSFGHSILLYFVCMVVRTNGITQQ